MYHTWNQERKFYMTNNSLNVEKYRVNMEVYGSLFGRQIFTVMSRNADPKYNEKRRAGLPCLISPLKIYDVVKIDVVSMKADVDAGGNPVVIFNDDSKLRFSIAKPDFREVTVATVREALESFEAGGQSVLFSDCAKITAEVCALNAGEQIKANNIAKEHAEMASMYRDVAITLSDSSRRYYEQINQATAQDAVSVNLIVEQ